MFQYQQDEDVRKRCYPNFIPKSKKGKARYGEKTIGDPSKAAVQFMQAQGLPKFDTNSGRKALARWCKKLNVPYELSVHIHGDLPTTWNDNYESGAVSTTKIAIRKQSRDPEVATAALRIFADWIERGFNPYQRPMTVQELQQDALLQHYGHGDIARKIRQGCSTWQNIKPASLPSEPRPKKRKRPVETDSDDDLTKYSYKLSDIESDTDLHEYMRKPKKKKPKPEPRKKRQKIKREKPSPKPKPKPKPKKKN